MKITQTSKDKTWYDEKGTGVPLNRINKVERLHERLSGSLLKKAQKLNKDLKAFKELVNDYCTQAFDAFMADKNVDINHKGNFTWYNFNRTIKVEVSVNERIEFDDMGIKAAKQKLDDFLSISVESKNEFVKDLILTAFETSRGKLDVKKVMQLIRYKSKIDAPIFKQAIELLEQSIRRPDSKTYFRVWLKGRDGKYENIDLNFSSI
ncbi:DUF3164 family protein [Pseudotenacibaculum haliotis]|uniref:DUF3164 family protein n=1 Tax=Pseudotenacibaculum haliotis TaxID=1862138 RepID=A0ABW5LNV8_9FLAO